MYVMCWYSLSAFKGPDHRGLEVWDASELKPRALVLDFLDSDPDAMAWQLCALKQSLNHSNNQVPTYLQL